MHRNMHTYLHDHLAAACAALELIELLHKHTEDSDVRHVLGWLLLEVKQDEATLQQVTESLSVGSSALKDSAAWVSARFVSLKTNEGEEAFGRFEGLEVLTLVECPATFVPVEMRQTGTLKGLKKLYQVEG